MTTLRPTLVRATPLVDIAATCGGRVVGEAAGIDVTGIELGSSAVRPGDLFAALPGARHHGANFALDAIAHGAVAVLTDATGASMLEGLAAPLVVVSNPREALGEVAAVIYESADAQRLSFGVTGTNGKTSIVYCLAAILESLGLTTALSTTAQRRIGEREVTSDLTTPEAPELHAFLGVAREFGAQALALEVSAQALTRSRVAGIHFDVVAFANLSHDHLDDYDTFDDYFEAKRMLFEPAIATSGVVCIDDEWGRRLASEVSIPVVTVSLDPDQPADWHVEILAESVERTTFRLYNSEVSLTSHVPVLGDFMAVNAAIAIVMAMHAGISFDAIATAIGGDAGLSVYIPGRLEVVSGPVGPVCVVDYGHTPEAFRASLDALRRIVAGKIIMVFGADGDRDVSKRGELGAIAARGADTVIVTDFHPRSEDPSVIRAALLSGAWGARPDGDIREIADPATAVRTAISLAHSGDIIFYAGPGHENYREQAGVKIPYNARDDVARALDEAGYPTEGLT